MTISFPSSPTVNQTYTVGSKTWAWNGSTWKISSTALFITGDTAPTSPLAGSLWYDTTDATLYIRSGSAWLEAVIAKEGTPGIAGTSSNPYPIGNTASRPYSPTSGYTRINSETNNIEVYYNSAWYNLQYIGIITATGGTVSYSGNYKIHTFTTTSTFIVADAPVGTMVQYLVVAGGGAGGGTTWQGGGGGAGGLLSGSALTVTSGITYAITIGAGAAAQTNGTDSSFSSLIIATGGGYGGSETYSRTSGGSGGGGSHAGTLTGASGIAGQGFAGGTGSGGGGPYGGGGGGGAGAQGGNANVGGLGGVGGVGVEWPVTSGVYYGGGGAGSIRGVAPTVAALGGGGTSNGNGAGGNGTVNTGGGGGAGGSNNGTGGAGGGGSGVVIIRYRYQ